MTAGFKRLIEKTLEKPFSQVVDLNVKMWQVRIEKREDQEDIRLIDRLHRWMIETFETPFLQGDMAEVENWSIDESTKKTGHEDLEPVCFYM